MNDEIKKMKKKMIVISVISVIVISAAITCIVILCIPVQGCSGYPPLAGSDSVGGKTTERASGSEISWITDGPVTDAFAKCGYTNVEDVSNEYMKIYEDVNSADFNQMISELELETILKNEAELMNSEGIKDVESVREYICRLYTEDYADLYKKMKITDAKVTGKQMMSPDAMPQDIRKSYDEFDQNIVSFLEKTDELALVEMDVDLENGMSQNGRMLFYRLGDRWYCPAGIILIPTAKLYYEKSQKADDVTCAGTMNTAMNAAAANEDVYDEIWKLDNEPYILEVSADGRIKSRVNSSLDHTILEFGANMGIMDLKGNHIEGETLIKYTGNGADHWLIAWKEDHAYIYLANKDESMIWEVSPNIDKEYY